MCYRVLRWACNYSVLFAAVVAITTSTTTTTGAAGASAAFGIPFGIEFILCILTTPVQAAKKRKTDAHTHQVIHFRKPI